MFDQDPLLRIGDAVKFQNPGKGRTQGEIQGFGTFVVHRFNNCGLEPGIYFDTRRPIVKSSDNSMVMVNRDRLTVADPKILSRRREALNENPYQYFMTAISNNRLGDLPKTNLIEGDKVKIPAKIPPGLLMSGQVTPEMTCLLLGKKTDHKKTAGYITWIDYPETDYGATEGANFQLYMPGSKTPGETILMPFFALDLLEQGKVRAYERAATETLAFDSAYEESNFYRLVGDYTNIRNPQTRNYGFTTEEVLEAIRAGLGDTVTPPGNGFFRINRWGPHRTRGPERGLLKFKDPEVGKRVRALFL